MQNQHIYDVGSKGTLYSTKNFVVDTNWKIIKKLKEKRKIQSPQDITKHHTINKQ